MAVNRRTVVIVAIVAIAISAVASYSLYRYLKGQEEKVKEVMKVAVATQKVVVASKEIPVGEAIMAAQVKAIDWPQESAPAGAIATPEEVIGRTVLQTIEAGNPVTETKLMPVGGLPGIMTYKIPEGHRAMTVGVDQVSGVAGFITPNSMVDVVLTATPQGQKQPLSKIILQNIPVLATGQVIEQKEGKPVLVPTVTLDVTPDEAERLAMAKAEGTLQLLLRRAGDDDIAKTMGATITKVIRQPGKARPSTKVAGKKKVTRRPTTISRRAGVQMENVSVEVYRDAKKTVETFRVKKEDQ